MTRKNAGKRAFSVGGRERMLNAYLRMKVFKTVSIFTEEQAVHWILIGLCLFTSLAQAQSFETTVRRCRAKRAGTRSTIMYFWFLNRILPHGDSDKDHPALASKAPGGGSSRERAVEHRTALAANKFFR